MQYNQSFNHAVLKGGTGVKWSGGHKYGRWRRRGGETATFNQGPEKKGEIQFPIQIDQF